MAVASAEPPPGTMSAVSETPSAASSQGAAPAPSGGFRSWPRWSRWSTYGVGVVVLLLVAALVAGAVVVRDSFPQTDGDDRLPGLDGKVEVVRDDHGIPQIYADTATTCSSPRASSRRRTGSSRWTCAGTSPPAGCRRCSGEDTLETDKVVRTLGWRRVAEQELSTAEPGDAGLPRGVQRRRQRLHRRRTRRARCRWSTPCSASRADYQVEDWTPADSVAWLKAMAWDLRGNMQDEIDRGRWRRSRSTEEIAELYPPYPYDRHRPIVDQGAVVDEVFEQDATSGGTRSRPGRRSTARPTARSTRVDAALERAAVDAHGRSARRRRHRQQRLGRRRRPLHDRQAAPGQRPAPGADGAGRLVPDGAALHEVDDDCPFDVSGFTFAGFPGVVIGHNQQIAWGFTNLGPDVTDLYLEKVDGERYLSTARCGRFERREETIEVAGGEAVHVHGALDPARPAALRRLDPADARSARTRRPATDAPDRGNGYAVALAWTALDADPHRRRGLRDRPGHRLGRVPGRRRALRGARPEPGLRRPRRPHRLPGPGPDPDPQVRATTATTRRPGWVRPTTGPASTSRSTALPSVLDPDDGFIATANQAVDRPGLPLLPRRLVGLRLPQPADRRPAAAARTRVSVADMARIQLDTRNGFAPTLVPYLLDDPHAVGSYLAGGQRLLSGWDYRSRPDSAAAAYFNAVWKNLLPLTFDDQLPPSALAGRRRPLVRGGAPAAGRARTAPGGTTSTPTASSRAATTSCCRRWPTRATSSCAAVAAGRRLDLGPPAHAHPGEPDPRRSPTSALVRRLFNRGGYQVGGGGEIVDATGWNAAAGYEVTSVPSMRMVVSLADLDDSTLGEPHRRQRARVHTALHRPDRRCGRRARRCRGRSRRDAVEGAAERHARRLRPGRNQLTPGRGHRRRHGAVVRRPPAPGRPARRRRAACR